MKAANTQAKSKTFLALSLLASFGTSSVFSQVLSTGTASVQTASAVITESGPDYRVWQSLDPIRASTPGSGRMVELATGMNYWDGTNWSESVAQFKPGAQTYVASQVQHRTEISDEINVAGAVSLTTPEGQVINSTPVGIGLYDAASGQSVLIATITNTPGVLVGTNQVYFENAFRGGACASVLYTLERDSFSQDVIFSGYLDPQAYGFPTNTTRIQIITELYQPPTPEILRQPMYVETNTVLRQAMQSPDLIDERLSFDRLVVGVGQAYTQPSLLTPAGSASLVAKEFVQTSDGRYFLIESVPYRELQTGFYTLPDCSPAGGGLQGVIPRKSLKGMLATLPNPPRSEKAKLANRSRPGRIAMGTLPKRPSVIIDYRATLNTGATLVQADTTYLVSGGVSCTTLTIEGGAVLKYKVGAPLSALIV
jgi:hypothetical protein